MSITRDLWIKALFEAGLPTQDDQDALTYAEYAEMMGCSPRVAELRMRTLARKGLATRTTKVTLDGRGRTYPMVAYRLTDVSR